MTGSGKKAGRKSLEGGSIAAKRRVKDGKKLFEKCSRNEFYAIKGCKSANCETFKNKPAFASEVVLERKTGLIFSGFVK